MSSSFSTVDLTSEEYAHLMEIRAKKAQLLDEIQVLQSELSRTNACIESLNDTTETKSMRNKTDLAKRNFNSDPAKGLKYLVEVGLTDGTPKDVARFFLFGSGTRKSAIGDFLGEKDPFNLEVLRYFVRIQNFKSFELVRAMRDFLLLFRLPGEAQKIDRIMEKFAGEYCEQNPNLFNHPDTCYTLCYAIIMLNTSLHNPSVKEKMSLDNFLRMTDSMDLSREFVTEIYNSIRLNPFKFPEDDFSDHCTSAVFQSAEKQGWLQKQGSRYRTLNKRWFVLANRCLYYFEFPSSKEPRGIIPLENVRVRVLGQEADNTNRRCAFEIYSPNSDVVKACKADSDGRIVEAQHMAYRMAAENREEMHSWISWIQRNINKDQGIEEMLERRARTASVNNGKGRHVWD